MTPEHILRFWFEELEPRDWWARDEAIGKMIAHRDIVERFGRYPHRNRILGRESTAEELEFLRQPGSSF